ncbi:MAG: hypothetical protein D6689_08380 [Deltaproteobacteria bacterium]|nr:MAG: hypothetical protein D6689_08380 [Deltaproteobacteria bacterium]
MVTRDSTADELARLRRDVADSEWTVQAWSLEANELVVRVDKDVGGEIGRLVFGGVGHVCLPPAVTVADVEIHTRASVPDDFWHTSAPPKDELGDAERIVVVYGSYGGRFYVVAETIDYEILQ